jgi:hypothetical protein
MIFVLSSYRTLISKLLLFGLLCLGALATRAVEDRILLDATINGKAVRLVFDTGASDLILFKEGAGRLGLKVTEPPSDLRLAPGEVAVGTTGECDFMLGSTRTRTSLKVFDPPSFIRTRADGAVGWRQIRYNTIQIDAGRKTATWLDKAPAETSAWLKFRIRSQSRILGLEIPDQEKPGGVLTIDTGSFCGVAMSPLRWQAWKAAHTNEPATLMAGYMPGAGTVVVEENWAKELTVGPLVLTEVPVMPANVAEQAMGTAGFEVSFGLAALSRLDLIIDGNLGIAYLRPKKGTAPPYQHNRLGAVFAPSPTQAADLVARVIEGSPAYVAGIRNGDVLVAVGDLDTTTWRTDPKVLPLSRFWEGPPVTKLNLTLKRGSETITATPVLRQILGPAGAAPASAP